MNSWEETGIEFDGITTGFIGSKEQIGLVIEFFKRFKKENTLAVVDPVMGDYGKLYSSYTDDMCQEMKKLLPYADVLTPNLTEACRILDLDYHKVDLSEEGLVAICEALSDMGPSRIVITGLQQGDLIFNYIFEKNKHGKFDNTYEWCASKVSPQKNILRNIPPETMGTWIPTFQKGESIIIRNVNEIVSYDPYLP